MTASVLRRPRRVPRTSWQASRRRPAPVGVRAAARRAAATARGRWSARFLIAFLLTGAVRARSRSAAHAAERARTPVRPARRGVPAARTSISSSSLPSTALRDAGALDRRRRTRMVRLALPADHLHGNAFRKIEYLIEGSASSSSDAIEPHGRGRRRSGSKHAIFFSLSFVIANVFLAWVIGSRGADRDCHDRPDRHLQGSHAILVFSVVFYLVFARFREQACVLACPYGQCSRR